MAVQQLDQPCGVQGRSPGRPLASRPAEIGVSPSTSLTAVTGGAAIVGRFEGDGVYRRRLLVVIRSMLEPARTTVRPQRPVAVAARFDPATGAWSVGSGRGEPVELSLPAGGATLLELERRRP
ncbi:MAG: hypothetical protein ACRDPC_21165 [Solirubrobacteraceae bacterium]